jgi:hypothetical protein
MSIIDLVFNKIDNFSSVFAGRADGILGMLDFNPFLKYSKGLSKFSIVVMGIGIGPDVVMSVYTNFNNDSLTTGQQWGSFGADVFTPE